MHTQDSTNQDENFSDNTIYDKIAAETYYKDGVHNHHKSMARNSNNDLRTTEEEKQYGSDQMVKEYEDDLDREFDSPMEYKAISPSPNLNNSAMSKEIGLDDRTSKIKEDERNEISATESISFPLTAAKTIIHYGKYLTEYEESEILNYMIIYYVNIENANNNTTRSGRKKTKRDKNEYSEIKATKGNHL